MPTLRNLVISMVFGMLILVTNGCSPNFPQCDTDEQCASAAAESSNEAYKVKTLCVGQLCRQCRDDQQCTTPGQICSGYQCVYRSGYCDENMSCPGDQKCRSNKCGPMCLDNSECSNTEYCEEGSCVAKPECGPNADKADCPDGYKCTGSGSCEKIKVSCNFSSPIYFAFGSASIKRGEKSKFNSFVNCMKKQGASDVTLAGHADEVGDTSYNMALGDKRANAVRRVLTRLGVDSSMLNTRSYGEEQPAVDAPGRQAKNRRVETE